MKGLSKTTELSQKVALYRDRGILINNQSLKPDLTRAYVESYQSHAFPVVTLYGTALHPQVVANSFQSMQHKLLDLHHLIVAYNPEQNPRDRVLGTIVGVEFPPTPEGGWKVQSSKANAPCIRAVSVIHRQLEQAEEIIEMQVTGKMKWTVSMEHKYNLDECGFLVAGSEGLRVRGSGGWRESTPQDLKSLGYTYVPYTEAMPELLACFDENEAKVIDDFHGQKVVCLLGGINGVIHYMGIGLTPIGKEKEAYISQMLASGISYVDVDGDILPEMLAPMQRLVNLVKVKK